MEGIKNWLYHNKIRTAPNTTISILIPIFKKKVHKQNTLVSEMQIEKNQQKRKDIT